MAFAGGTETLAMGIVEFADTEDVSFGWWLMWANDSTLESVAREQTRDFAAHYEQFRFEAPVSVVVEGFPGLRYDMLADSVADQELPPKMQLFLDTGGAIAMFFGEAGQPDVSLNDLFIGARNAARILKKAE